MILMGVYSGFKTALKIVKKASKKKPKTIILNIDRFIEDFEVKDIKSTKEDFTKELIEMVNDMSIMKGTTKPKSVKELIERLPKNIYGKDKRLYELNIKYDNERWIVAYINNNIYWYSYGDNRLEKAVELMYNKLKEDNKI